MEQAFVKVFNTGGAYFVGLYTIDFVIFRLKPSLSTLSYRFKWASFLPG